MNALERAARRMSPRPMAFAGAQMTRLTEDWLVGLLSADAEIKGSLKLLRARSRQLCQDNGHFAGWLLTMPEQVIGWEHDGIRVQSRVRGSDGGGFDRRINGYLEEQFQTWCEPSFCSADGVSSFGDLQRMGLRTMAQDGEFFAQRLPGFETSYGYALHQIDADLLDDQFNVPLGAGPGGREIRMGVELDQWNRPVAYHFSKRHPSEFGPQDRVRVDARQILHLFVRYRAGQTRGIPWTTPILLIHRMLDGYTESEVMQARIAASAGGFFEMTGEDAATFGSQYQDQASLSGESTPRLQMDLEPGLARQLPPGLKWSPWAPTHPNQNFPAFQKAILKTVARGINAAYTTFTGDLTEVNYGSMRGGSLVERDGYRALQRLTWWRFVKPEYRHWLEAAWLAGALATLGTTPPTAYAICQPQYRGWPWIDPLDDIQAREAEVALGVNSRQRICAELGRDWEDVLEELAEEQSMAKAAGVEIVGSKQPLVRRPEDGAPSQNGKPAAAEYPNRLAGVLEAAINGNGWPAR